MSRAFSLSLDLRRHSTDARSPRARSPRICTPRRNCSTPTTSMSFEPSPFDVLPDPLIFLIFSFLNEHEKCKIALVSKRWRELSYNSSSRWETLTIRPSSSTRTKYSLSSPLSQLRALVRSRFPEMKRLVFQALPSTNPLATNRADFTKAVPSSVMRALLPLCCRTLESLVILGAEMDQWGWVSSALVSCSNLRTLQIPLLNDAILLVIGNKLPYLAHLSIRRTFVSPDGFASLPLLLPSLTTIGLGHLLGPRFVQTLRILAESRVAVRTLRLQFGSFDSATADVLVALASKGSLEELELQYVDIAERALITLLPSCRHLKRLILPDSASDRTLLSLKTCDFPDLRVIGLMRTLMLKSSSHHDLTRGTLLECMRKLPDLRRLEISLPRDFSPSVLHGVPEASPSLKNVLVRVVGFGSTTYDMEQHVLQRLRTSFKRDVSIKLYHDSCEVCL
eukprot:CAMPEP_0184659678 /NCGR_PEP_ID=MMETSP0308-20130426/30646_1 /TAXON_ID=38269 /ORGANISM="Gloeochaete witrockiana, Strain SAG 46.84" /LENGTH=450 /DNA_ID=CAMNT_0027099693 /DNA_START=174 /DNA_END=1526 /DNA_ORIENTATION=-